MTHDVVEGFLVLLCRAIVTVCGEGLQEGSCKFFLQLSSIYQILSYRMDCSPALLHDRDQHAE